MKRAIWLLSVMILGLSGLVQNGYSTVVQTTNRIINNGSADFGSGTHAGGGPTGNATITYDWTTITGVEMRSTGRVRGTLYWDAAFGSGCARLTIRFRNAANVNLAVRQITECGPGGNANDAANKTAVDESFGSASLSHIVLTTAVLDNGNEVNPSSSTITQIVDKTFPVTINNGQADFGDGGHAFGSPTEPGHINFHRNGDGTVRGSVDGILFWDSSGSQSCSRIVIDYRNPAGAILDNFSGLNCGPGGNANNAANQFFVLDSFTSVSLNDIRILIDTLANPTGGVLRTFNFAGQVGDFEVEPANAVVSVNDPVSYGFIWTVPEPLNWHDLNTMELRIRDGATTILHLRFEEEGNLVSLYNDAAGKFGKASPVGSNKKLQTQYATLDLGETTVGPVNGALGAGPLSPTIRLGLALRFKPSAAGRSYLVEVAATDDLGNSDPFAVAGNIAVLD